jgi:predicted nucleic acid-binding Zn ribbon protein
MESGRSYFFTNGKKAAMGKDSRLENPHPVAIGQVIQSLMDFYRKAPMGKLSILAESWETAVGPAIARNTRPVAIKGGLLLIHVSSSVWMQQLQFMKNDILISIHRALGSEWFHEIKFKIGKV